MSGDRLELAAAAVIAAAVLGSVGGLAYAASKVEQPTSSRPYQHMPWDDTGGQDCTGGLDANGSPACQAAAYAMAHSSPGIPVSQGGACPLEPAKGGDQDMYAPCMELAFGPRWDDDGINVPWWAWSPAGVLVLWGAGYMAVSYVADRRTRQAATDPATVPSLPVLQEV